MDNPNFINVDNYFQHQDWKTYVIKKKPKKNEKTKTKKGPSNNLDANDTKLKHKKVDKNFGKKIQQYRLAHKWNQKTLAQKTNYIYIL